MKFFEFCQNNTGGSFDVDENLTHRVLIEAEDYDEAIRFAEGLGMYWNGVENGMDCPCCGDRWYKPSDGKEFPFKYGRMSLNEANSIAESCGVEVVKSKDVKSDESRSYDVMFPTPESYVQYLANEYGWTDPDGYIYYKNGNKVSITGRIYKRK